MSVSYNLAEILTSYYNFPVGPDFSSKVKVSNFDLKLCQHQSLNKTSLPTQSQKFSINHLRDINFSRYTCII
jgi:hypothetical protein